MSEESRAAAYRGRYAARAAFNAFLKAQLGGSPTAAAANRAAWRPIQQLNEDGGQIEDGEIQRVKGVANQG